MPYHIFSPAPLRWPLIEQGRHRLRLTFRAMRHRDFTLFWLGQWVSVIGTWMQTMALSWLIYRLTDSALVLGVLAAVRFGPSLLGSPFAGVLADRFPRRNLVLLTQSASLLLASALAALTLTGTVKVWHILTLALVQGVVDTLDMTARQTMQMDLVGQDDLQSAVALNSAAFNTGRMVGPAVAGVLVAVYGEGICFAINAASYLAVLVALLSIRGIAATPRSGASVGRDLLEGMRFTWGHPTIRTVLLAVAITSMAGLSYSTLLPVLARDILKAGAPGCGRSRSARATAPQERGRPRLGPAAVVGGGGGQPGGGGGRRAAGQPGGRRTHRPRPGGARDRAHRPGAEPGALDLLRLDGAGGSGRDHATGRD